MQRLAIYLFSLALTLGGYAAGAAGDSKAAELMAQARAALGGDAKLGKVQALSAAGTFQRDVGDRQMSGELTIDLQLPDKMVRTDSMNPVGDATVVILQGVNGDQVLRNSRTMGGGPGMMIRVAPPPAGSDAEGQALRNARADLARFALAFLLTAPPSSMVEFTYAGEAEADNEKADVVEAKGQGSFAAQIFLDKKSHRPLMLQYRGVAPQIRIQTQQVQGPNDPARARQAEEAARTAAAAQPPPQVVDITLYFDDYKAVDGVQLPHHISRSVDGKPAEETTFTAIKLNPSFKAGTFDAR